MSDVASEKPRTYIKNHWNINIVPLAEGKNETSVWGGEVTKANTAEEVAAAVQQLIEEGAVEIKLKRITTLDK